LLPDATIAWRDIWVGALVTALLFTAGKYGLGFYLGHSSVGSAYGAAGSLYYYVSFIIIGEWKPFFYIWDIFLSKSPGFSGSTTGSSGGSIQKFFLARRVSSKRKP
jgi:hypothetical protein